MKQFKSNITNLKWKDDVVVVAPYFFTSSSLRNTCNVSYPNTFKLTYTKLTLVHNQATLNMSFDSLKYDNQT